MKLEPGHVETIVERVLERLEAQGIRTASTASHSGASAPVFDTGEEACAAARRAFQELSELPLETRNRMVAALRTAIEEAAPELARLAVEETGLGRVEDKIKKNLLVGRKTPGTEILAPYAVSGDHGLMLEERAPYGVILSVTPSTNPSETVINNGIGMLAGGNAVVFAPHPGAARVSIRAVEILEQAARRAGGPANVFTTIRTPSIEATQALMRDDAVRLIVVTGGAGVVKEAMSAGKRAITAGPGNPPVVVDETADLERAGRGIYAGASLDNNIVCTDEKEVVAVERIAGELLLELERAGAYRLKGREIDLVRKVAFHEDRGAGRRSVVNKELIGKDAGVILAKAGIAGPKDTRLLVAQVDTAHPFLWTEMMMPVIGVCAVRDVDQAIDFAKEVEGGNRHTAAMYSHDVTKLSRMARIIDCSIFVKNGPTFNGLGEGGEGYTSYTIASPTGEGMTTARSFTRQRRCTLVDSFRIV
jgi:acyl-CoA reductase-like NAD-dependent aldehyde dehydrogenase